MSKKSEYTLTDLDGKVYIIPNRRNKKSYDMRTNPSLVNANLAKEASGGITLTGVNLQGCNLSDADLSGADLSGANLRGTKLHEAKLSGANLYGVDIGKSTVSDKNTNLEDSDITDAVLWYPKLQHITAKSIRENNKTVDRITRNILNNPNNECDEAISKLLMARITGIKGLASLFNNYGCDALKRLFLSFKASKSSCDPATMMFKKAVKDYINNIRPIGLITKPEQKMVVYPDSKNISLFQVHKSILKDLIEKLSTRTNIYNGWSGRNSVQNRRRLLNYFDKKVTSALSSIFTSSQIQSYIDGCSRVIQMKKDYTSFHDLAAIANKNYYDNDPPEWYPGQCPSVRESLLPGDYYLYDVNNSLNRVETYICDHAEEFQPYDIIFMGSEVRDKQKYGFYILVKTCLDSIELMPIGEWFYNLEPLNIREPTENDIDEEGGAWWMGNSGYGSRGNTLHSEYLEAITDNIITQRETRVLDFIDFLRVTKNLHISIPAEILGATKKKLDVTQRLTNFFQPGLNSACIFFFSEFGASQPEELYPSRCIENNSHDPYAERKWRDVHYSFYDGRGVKGPESKDILFGYYDWSRIRIGSER